MLNSHLMQLQEGTVYQLAPYITNTCSIYEDIF